MHDISQKNPYTVTSEPEISNTIEENVLETDAKFFYESIDKIIQNLIRLQCNIYNRLDSKDFSGKVCEITGSVVTLKDFLEEFFDVLLPQELKDRENIKG